MTVLVRQYVRISALFFAMVFIPGCASGQITERNAGVQSAGRDFLTVLETEDPDRLKLYVNTQTALDDEIWVSDEVFRFFFDGDWIRQFSEDGKSVLEIVAEGNIEIMPAPQREGTFILIFIPEDYSTEARSPEFYSEEWMRKYFACEFSQIEDRWQISTNLCFAATGGPFQEDYG